MTAIYKKELKSYLTSMIGYLFMAFTLALFGLYFTAINLQQGYPEVGYALQEFTFILLIAVPVLTMRVLSEEQKNKTDQLLLTAPVKVQYYPWKISGASYHLRNSGADHVPVSAASWNPRNRFLRRILHLDSWLFPAGSNF